MKYVLRIAKMFLGFKLFQILIKNVLKNCENVCCFQNVSNFDEKYLEMFDGFKGIVAFYCLLFNCNKIRREMQIVGTNC